jgi:hypothetical protein
MKKILTIIISSLFLFSTANAERGINIGISGNLAVFHATGSETEGAEKSTEDATGVAGYASIFVEKELGPISVGLDYVPSALSSETANNDRLDIKGVGTASTAVTNKVKVDFEDLTTLYVSVNTPLGVYVKAGLVQVDVNTKETLGTGSTYGNTDMDGHMFGIGYNNSLDNGMFMRFEGTMMDFGSASVTGSNTDNKVSISKLEGASAKISIGKSF